MVTPGIQELVDSRPRVLTRPSYVTVYQQSTAEPEVTADAYADIRNPGADGGGG